jgi:hypothetical protein
MNETLQGGRFFLTGLLGEGAQGRTFDAIDRRDGRRVAVKRFDVRGASRWKDAELAEREARVLQSLCHPKLPRYIDHFEEQGSLYLVMEKIEGETLASLRARGRTLPPALDKTRSWLPSVACGSIQCRRRSLKARQESRPTTATAANRRRATWRARKAPRERSSASQTSRRIGARRSRQNSDAFLERESASACV